uniref:DENN domain-containing protein 5B n=1 Tax=Anthurium amnicola TaxID=1678845 RepID=A0A1D1XYC1_9ARAE
MEEVVKEVRDGQAAEAPGQERVADEAAVRAGGEASTTAESACQNSSSSCYSPIPRVRSIRHQRSSSFQRWRRQMQRVWRWGPASVREQGTKTSVNLEAMANQKRQWYQIHSQSRGYKQHKEPTSLFEHFFIVGLHSDSNMEAIEDAFAKRKTWESEVAKSEIFDLRKLQYHGRLPILEPQILFKYPPGKRLAMRERDLPAFCFPGGVEARLMERTPSMSDLNEVVFGQEHQSRDDLSFIFCLKAPDNATLYGVCLHVEEIVQKAPGILGALSPLTRASGKSSRFLVSAPRCYCILTRLPFFELHYEMLNSLIAQERLERITQLVNEMSLTDSSLRGVKDHDQVDEYIDSPSGGSSTNWVDFSIPVDGILGLTAPSSSLTSDKDISPFSFRVLEPESPESVVTSEASDFAYTKELDKDGQRSPLYFDDLASESSDSRCDSFERATGSYENGQISPTIYCSISRQFECLETVESVYSSVRGVRSDCEEDAANSKYEKVVSDEKVMEWAKANNNEELQIVCSYHSLPIPRRGSEIVFRPLEHLQPVKYSRSGVSALGLSGTYSDIELSYPSEIDEVNARLAAAEEALALSIWTTATICRALSLESILALFAGTLLEKQMVVICPNLGVLSATVLSLVPMIRPFEWQSLLLPVLPRKMLDFLDAPVPFIVGIQHKPADLKIKATNLIRVNVCKDQVKMCSLPPLPRHRELVSELNHVHARLSCENYIAKRHPVYRCSEVQAEAAKEFLNILRNYLESLCSNLRSNTITSVQSNRDRVSLLLKDSFIDSFPNRDRPFIKLFVDTQMFSVLSDSRLSIYENEAV